MRHIAASLADEFQLRQLIEYLRRDHHTLLREQQRVAAFHLLDHAGRVGICVVVDFYLVSLQLGIGAGVAQGVGVVVNDGNFHKQSLG